MREPLRGEVWEIDLGLAAKVRKVIIVSRDDANSPRALKTYVPITTKNRGSEYEVELPKTPFLSAGSVANAQGIAAAPTHKFERKVGDLPANSLVKLEQALLFALGLKLT